VDLAYPNVCRSCQDEYLIDPEVNLLCYDCTRRLIKTTHWNSPKNYLYERLITQMPIEKAASLLVYEDLSVAKGLLHNFKYKKLTDIGHVFGAYLADKMVEHKWHEGMDCIVPIPMTAAKERLRGFNTAQILAEEIAVKTRLPIVKDALKKMRNTVSQTQKGKSTRQANASLLFRMQNKEAVKNKHVMLVDDIVTTGSTISNAGLELVTGGISKLSIVALCTANNENAIFY
jgi:ComF family protein